MRRGRSNNSGRSSSRMDERIYDNVVKGNKTWRGLTWFLKGAQWLMEVLGLVL